MKKIISLAIALAMLFTFAACGSGSARRAAVVGIRLDLDGVSGDNIAAVIYGGGSVLSALRGRLAEAYGDTVAFDLYYSQPDESGGREYVLFGEASPGEAKDTITLPVDINGAITPENLAQVVDALLGQITAQLGEWGYEARTTATTGTITGSTQGISTGETSTEEWTLPAMARTSDTNISGGTTAKPALEMYPQELILSNDQIVEISRSINGEFWQYANGGFNLAIPVNSKTYVFRRADDLNKRDYFEQQFHNGKTETVGLYLVTGQRDGKVVSQRINTYSYTINDDPAGYRVHIVPDRNDTRQLPGRPAPSAKSIQIKVGGNTGGPFSYRVTPDFYIIPDDKTIFLN